MSHPRTCETLPAGTATPRRPALSADAVTDFAVAEGTRLLTRAGWQTVETLAQGDTLVTATGQFRTLPSAARAIPGCGSTPDRTGPPHIRVAAGAFGPDLPRCDVVLPSDQAVFIEDALIPIGHLVNAATIRREASPPSRMFRLAVPYRDVLVADGLPVGAAPPARTDRGPASIMHRARAHLIARASVLDHRLTQDADLHLAADGVRIWGQQTHAVWSGWVPEGARSLRIVSRASAPADCLAESDDHRPLGVALRGITLHLPTARIDLAATQAGWGEGTYPAESNDRTGWRWTNGNAEIPRALWQDMPGPFRVDLHLLRAHTYRLEDATDPVATSAELWFSQA